MKKSETEEKKPFTIMTGDEPGYPEGLNIYPESYTIYLSEDQWNPITKIAEETTKPNGGK